jgi:hypothetical protein
MTDRPVADIVAEARPAERTVELCLRGDLVATLEDLRRRQEAAKAASRTSLDDDPGAGLAEQVADVQARMAEAVVVVALRAVPRRRWLALLADHPPRDGADTDTRLGFDPTTFYDALVAESWAEPQITDDDRARLLDSLSAGQFDLLAEAAWSVNARAVSVPFGWRASPSTPS